MAIPDETEKLIIALRIYGPGDVWFDDVSAEYTDAEPTDPTASNAPTTRPPADTAKTDPHAALADVPFEVRKAGDDVRKR